MKKIIELEHKEFYKKDLESPLRKISEEVTEFGVDLENNIKDLRESFYSLKISVGLAAPQIGINKRIIIVNMNKDKLDDLILINPVIVSNTGNYKEAYESCLSLPKFRGKVKRRKKIELEYQDVFGNKVTAKESGFLARVLLHEIDHLEGILYVDRMDEANKLEKVDFDWE